MVIAIPHLLVWLNQLLPNFLQLDEDRLFSFVFSKFFKFPMLFSLLFAVMVFISFGISLISSLVFFSVFISLGLATDILLAITKPRLFEPHRD